MISTNLGWDGNLYFLDILDLSAFSLSGSACGCAISAHAHVSNVAVSNGFVILFCFASFVQTRHHLD